MGNPFEYPGIYYAQGEDLDFIGERLVLTARRQENDVEYRDRLLRVINRRVGSSEFKANEADAFLISMLADGCLRGGRSLAWVPVLPTPRAFPSPNCDRCKETAGGHAIGKACSWNRLAASPFRPCANCGHANDDHATCVVIGKCGARAETIVAKPKHIPNAIMFILPGGLELAVGEVLTLDWWMRYADDLKNCLAGEFPGAQICVRVAREALQPIVQFDGYGPLHSLWAEEIRRAMEIHGDLFDLQTSRLKPRRPSRQQQRRLDSDKPQAVPLSEMAVALRDKEFQDRLLEKERLIEELKRKAKDDALRINVLKEADARNNNLADTCGMLEYKLKQKRVECDELRDEIAALKRKLSR